MNEGSMVERVLAKEAVSSWGMCSTEALLSAAVAPAVSPSSRPPYAFLNVPDAPARKILLEATLGDKEVPLALPIRGKRSRSSEELPRGASHRSLHVAAAVP
ncbi:hypothetical protein, unlikely [Trypanosoma brucei gambiense DAL972]|uniref:Uncharacterized protein n=1 Tax=Trypanosoma brucei gambiense (strain MHOM/CI/86/DAL972) TaxID=679716 RepID=C9ZT64_TRYB9|nr:hypothetical protein, unlikely [Trypanosoma brucei gambiense DAL972]CBH12599.1 hypothetical protein, unlikely [Trypanosoma brucei gambiense DAL972]|eukprot:XP_011774879.1 hypothetical protein, unlikely [Trypanosoma brucei gambiense DAL972]